jgi:hypothetical protein
VTGFTFLEHLLASGDLGFTGKSDISKTQCRNRDSKSNTIHDNGFLFLTGTQLRRNLIIRSGSSTLDQNQQPTDITTQFGVVYREADFRREGPTMRR